MQKAFDAFSDYLSEQDFLPRKEVYLQVSGSKGITISMRSDGGAEVAVEPDDFETQKTWQLLRINDRLYLLPGHVHYKLKEEDTVYQYVEPCIDDTSIFADPRPYWDLPLELSTSYTVYLVVDACASPCEAFFVLLKDTENVMDYATEGSHVFVVHTFDTTAGGTYGDEGELTQDGGYPDLLYNSQRLQSEPTICCEMPTCVSSSSVSSVSVFSESVSEQVESVESEECIEVVTGLSCTVIDDDGRCCLDLTVEYTEICGVEVRESREEDLNCCE